MQMTLVTALKISKSKRARSGKRHVGRQFQTMRPTLGGILQVKFRTVQLSAARVMISSHNHNVKLFPKNPLTIRTAVTCINVS